MIVLATNYLNLGCKERMIATTTTTTVVMGIAIGVIAKRDCRWYAKLEQWC